MSVERTTKNSLAVGFTKGPWSFDSAGLEAPILRVACADGDHPAHEMRSYDEKVANALLMAAAPDLFAVAECEEALDMPNGQGVEILERYGWSHADRFDRPATDFVRELRRSALTKARSAP